MPLYFWDINQRALRFAREASESPLNNVHILVCQVLCKLIPLLRTSKFLVNSQVEYVFSQLRLHERFNISLNIVYMYSSFAFSKKKRTASERALTIIRLLSQRTSDIYRMTHSSDRFRIHILKRRWWIGASQALKETNPPHNIVANGVRWLNTGNRTNIKVSLVSTYLRLRTHLMLFHDQRYCRYSSLSLCHFLDGRREDRWLEQSVFAPVSDNSRAHRCAFAGESALLSIGYFRSQFKDLNQQCNDYIEKGSWPLCDYSLKKKVTYIIEQLQYEIATLCSLDRKDEGLKYVEGFCFSLVIRVYSIECIRTRKNLPGMDDKNLQFFESKPFGLAGSASEGPICRSLCAPSESIIQSANDYASCLNLVSLTHPKNVSYEINMEARDVDIPKKHSSKSRILDISNIVDRVLQLQLLLLLDPVVESTLPEHFYAFRQGRTPLQAIGFLSRSIQSSSSDLSRFHLVSVDMSKCFDSMSHDFILKRFPWPEKLKGLLRRWLKCIRVFKNGSKMHLKAGVPQGFIVGPVICNFVLSSLTKDFFEDTHFPKNPCASSAFSKRTKFTIPSASRFVRFEKAEEAPGDKVTSRIRTETRNVEVTRFLVGYAHNLMIQVISQEEAAYAIEKLGKSLAEADLDISKSQVGIYDLKLKSRFEWLGYTYLVIPQEDIHYSKLVGKGPRLTRGKGQVNQSALLNYITDSNYQSIKSKIKQKIQSAKHRNLLVVLKDVNSILRAISGYYSFGNNSARLDYLKYFVDRNFWRVLVEKFRFKGIRRPRWVARRFFITSSTKSSLDSQWHLHYPIPASNSIRKRNMKALWCVNVASFIKIQPLSVMILPKHLRKSSFYLNRAAIDELKFRIQSRRNNFRSVLGDLFKLQKGICPHCDSYLDLFNGDSVDIHHKLPLKHCVSKEYLAHLNTNMYLLHKHCNQPTVPKHNGLRLFYSRAKWKTNKKCAARTLYDSPANKHKFLSP
uniref:Reverse transcriptase domain-containing protein n=1 Tax=Ostreobium quekettii TaxID=121088 RepID=A0A650BYC7_9CHLO|nr:hypothetical protein [Ostreobium quekettii]QGQ62001.1 hypothetical protein [Ostreobium quekettii]